MVFPEKIKQGDTIGLVAPSSPVNRKGLDKCRQFFEDMGYHVVFGESAYSTYKGYLSGDDDIRGKDINKMFTDKSVSAIYCLRGGYGSCRIMDKIDLDIIKSNPKIFVGYSDITNLHLLFNQKAELVTFHGPMVFSNILNKYDDFTRQSFLNAINMEEELLFNNPDNEAIETLVPGEGQGTVIGGNLSLLSASIGTEYEPDTENKILFIEEIDEPTYRIDRMLHQLKHAGKLSKLSGIILGDFTGCEPREDGEYTLYELFEDIIKPLSIPTLYNIKSGHCFPMATIPLGLNCKMDATNKSIQFLR